MKLLIRVLPLWALTLLAAGAHAATPLGPGFVYQGQLIQNGTPVNGNVILRFTLWDAASGGLMLGGSQLQGNVPVANGLFVVQLNPSNEFGPNAFNGDARWLQIEVCTDLACTTPTLLSPRQPLFATPYAQFSQRSAFSTAPWQTNGTNVFYGGGNVGIGTSSPATPLHVSGNATIGSAAANNTALTIPGPNSPTNSNSAQDVRFAFGSAGSSRLRAYRGGSWDTYLQFLTNSAGQGSDAPQPRMTIDGDGNVGIGTTSPVVKLDVHGGIYIGTGPRYSVPGAEEDLKMVRGIIASNGTPTNGCCFSVSHPGTGQYTITYTTPYSGTPVVTCNGYALLNPVHIELITPDASSVRIQVRDNSGSLLNAGFHFFAIGPR